MRKVMLESFESDTPPAVTPDAGFEKGFAEGYQAGLSAAKDDQANLAHELVQTVADLEFKFDEAKGAIAQAMGPLFAALVSKVFPQLIEDGFPEQIVAVLLNTSSQSCSSEFSLCIHPSQSDAVITALSAASVGIQVSSDSALQLHEAWIHHDTGALHIDCDHLIDEIREILSSVNFIQTRSDTLGKPN